MWGRLKKEWQQMRTGDEHMAYTPPDTDDPETNFLEIKKLMERYGSQHSIQGDACFFTIGLEPHHHMLTVLNVLMALFFIVIGLIGAFRYDEPSDWFIIIYFWAMAVFMLAYRSKLGSYIGITVDSHSRLITVFDDNLIRRHYRPEEYIAFDSVHKLWSEEKYVGRHHFSTFRWNKIYLDHDLGTTQIMALPLTPAAVNHEVFMTCLMRIIKKQG